jgi:hypothetical protein
MKIRRDDSRHEDCFLDRAEIEGAHAMKRIILSFVIFGCLVGAVNARNLGQWDAVNPELHEWYEALMQPDVPNASCCGEADAYWTDEIHVRDGKTYAIITDDRDDARGVGLTSISKRKLRFRTINSSGTNPIQPGTASYS